MANKNTQAIATIAQNHKLQTTKLQKFIDAIMDRYIFDGEKLTDLLAPLNLGWKQRGLKEQELMEELSPLLRKMAKGKDISGLEVYDG